MLLPCAWVCLDVCVYSLLVSVVALLAVGVAYMGDVFACVRDIQYMVAYLEVMLPCWSGVAV